MADGGDNKSDIMIITADVVVDTGMISFKFMVMADPQRKLGLPHKFGTIIQDRPDSYGFNVLDRGGKLTVGGGWSQYDTPEWERKMLDALPSCTLLMDVSLLPWWEALTARHGVKFRHHHFEGTLSTS